jgi:23S rRNA (guanosine2251-2'-O)-methyltransferase
MKKLNSISDIKNYPEIKVWLVAENVRSAYNIGAMFRTADGTGQTGIILVGYSPTPDNPKVVKTSLGAERSVPWFHFQTSVEAAKAFKNEGILCVGLEIVSKAISVYEYTPNGYPIALFVGNEVEGILPETIAELDSFIYIPMKGKKQSLNVAEAASITMYEFYRKLV